MRRHDGWQWVAAVGLLAGAGLLWWGGARATTYQGQTLREWLAALTSADYRERNRAEAALTHLGPEALPDLERALRARDTRWRRLTARLGDRWLARRTPPVPAARVREQAARLLERLGPQAAPALPSLVTGLGDEDPETARAVEGALRRVGPVAVPELVAALRHRRGEVRRRAADLLGNEQDFGPAIRQAVLPLVAALRDREPAVRAQAAGSLGGVGRGHSPVVTGLARALTDRSPLVSAAAARALGEIGPSAQPAVGALMACMSQHDAHLRVEAARALWKVEGKPETIVPGLMTALQDPSVHWEAALALGEVGREADQAVPALLAALEREVVHRPSRTPASAALALARMGPVAVPGLVELLEHDKPWVRVGAALALIGHGPAARPAIPALLQMLNDPDGEARMTAANALGAIGAGAREALPKLTAMTREGDEYQRATAQAAVNRITQAPLPASDSHRD